MFFIFKRVCGLAPWEYSIQFLKKNSYDNKKYKDTLARYFSTTVMSELEEWSVV